MKELSLNILDIAENSVKANATLTEILIEETGDTLKLIITDNGKGMDADTVKSVTDPFFTSRKTRSVGLGIPLLKLACEQTGGTLSITSKTIEEFPDHHGTTVCASFFKNHIDFTPLGDVVSSIVTLIQGHPDKNFRFIHKRQGKEVLFDTKDIREVLEDIPLDAYEVILWIRDNLKEQYEEFYK